MKNIKSMTKKRTKRFQERFTREKLKEVREHKQARELVNFREYKIF